MSSVIVVTPPAATLVSLVEAKAHLRVDHGDEDARIQSLIWAAENEFAGPDGWVGRSLGLQELELRLAHFPCEDIALPCPPLLRDNDHALSVTYIDAAGAEQVAATDIYSVVTRGSAGLASIALNYGAAWPAPRWQAGAVRVRYFAGYAQADTRAEGLKAAVKLHVELHFDGEDEAKRRAMNALLAPYRVF